MTRRYKGANFSDETSNQPMRPTAPEHLAVKAAVAIAALILATSAQALPLRFLIEEQRAKIEPAVRKFQQECNDHTDSQQCKEEGDALVKALNEFLSLVRNGLKVVDAHASDASSDADFQKQIEALRARAQQHLQWGQKQLKALTQ
jgi:hypothetical protein